MSNITAAARRIEVLARQAALLAQVPMLSVADTIAVLKQEPEKVIVLIDAHSGTVKVPAFQFIRSNGALVPNPNVQAVYSVKRGYVGYPNLNINGAWTELVWWTTPMKLDAREPDTTTFRPIDVVDNAAMIAELVEWVRDWENEPGFG
ncbi:MAG: hypothetical protein ACQR33_03140 [Candidatus Saccharibacteria bacterium]